MSHLLLWIKLCHVSIGQHHMNTGCNKIVKDPTKISWYRYSVWRCCRNIIALIINASQRPAAPLHSLLGIGVMNADDASGSCWKLVLPLHVMSQDHQIYNLLQVDFWHVRCKSKIAVYAWKKLYNKKLYVTVLSLYDAFLCNWKSTQFRTHSLDFRDL